MSKLNSKLQRIQNITSKIVSSSVNDDLYEAIDRLEKLKEEFEIEEKLLTAEALDEIIKLLNRYARKI